MPSKSCVELFGHECDLPQGRDRAPLTSPDAPLGCFGNDVRSLGSELSAGVSELKLKQRFVRMGNMKRIA